MDHKKILCVLSQGTHRQQLLEPGNIHRLLAGLDEHALTSPICGLTFNKHMAYHGIFYEADPYDHLHFS